MRKLSKDRHSDIKNEIKRLMSSKNLLETKFVLNLEDEDSKEEEGKKNNIKKMKLNVVPLNTSINFVELRNIYIQRRISQKVNSWNVVNLANTPLLTNNNINEGINLNKIDLKLDPMLISEKICIKLYLYLSKVKIENYSEKNNNRWI